MTDKSTLTHNARGEFDLFKVALGIMSTLIAAGILFICASVVNSQVSIAELNKDVAALRVSFSRYEAANDAAKADIFTRKEADAAFALRNARLDEMSRDAARRDAATQALSARVTALEQKE